MIFIIVVIVACIVGYKLYQEYKIRMEARNEAIDEARQRFRINANKIPIRLSVAFSQKYGLYKTSVDLMNGDISKMENEVRTLRSLSVDTKPYSDEIWTYRRLVSGFEELGKKQKNVQYSSMIEPSEYGQIRKDYWDSVRSMKKFDVDSYISNLERYISSKDYQSVFTADATKLLRCVWFYATEKPYSVQSFYRAANLLEQIIEFPHTDITIADLYMKKQMGGEDAIRDVVYDKIRSSKGELSKIASALMWMKAYRNEAAVLQGMLSSGMHLTEKMQERLHSLTNGRGNAPDGYETSANDSKMYFDVSSIAWKDNEYIGFFENLEFQNKTLSYSLAVRDENKELFVTNGRNLSDKSEILSKLNSVFAEEYGNTVHAAMRECIALSGIGEENLDGILVETEECKHLGILLHIARIGKKINIKFYTLFMPGETGLEDQKQQSLSMYKKLSPSVTMWESSLKDTSLMAIQQLLNSQPQTAADDENSDKPGDGPIF